MEVKIHKLFQYLLGTTGAEPEASIGFSQSDPPWLGAFLDALDPGLPLDWNRTGFRCLPALRNRVLDRSGLNGNCQSDDVPITARSDRDE